MHHKTTFNQQFTKHDFKAFLNLHFSFTEVGWLQRHVSSLLAKFEFTMKNTVKQSKTVFNAPGLLQLPFLLTLMRLHLLQKSCAALQFLLFSVTVKLPSYISRASAKDLLNFHSLIFSLSNIVVYLTTSIFKNLYNSMYSRRDVTHHRSNRS